MPPLVFAQLLASPALHPAAVSRFRRVMSREGTDETTLVRNEAQAPLRWFREVYPDLDASQATELGRACADQAQPTSFGPLSIPLVSAGSVSEIVELLSYLPLITTALSPQFLPGERGLTIGLVGHTDDPDLDRLAITYCGCTIIRLLGLLVGETSRVTLHLSWPTPPHFFDHDDVSSGRLAFGAAKSFLRIPADTLEEVCRFSDPVSYRHALDGLQEAFKHRIGSTSFTDTVRRILDNGTPLRDGPSIAQELSMSLSTLKRRLAEEGTTFRGLRDSSLRERAELSLLDRNVLISEIATDLGYSDLTNFSHAFKRWTGLSPTRFRSRQQE